MNWRHYKPWATGTTCVIDGKYALTCPWEIGQICTGKQHVFHRYYVRIQLLDGTTVTGEDEHNVRSALFAVNTVLENRGLALLAAGLDEQWEESGLSHNSGYGFVAGVKRPVHMFEIPIPANPDPENEEFVEGLIREAIAEMTFGRPTLG